MENIELLLNHVQETLTDLCYLLIYLSDPSDHSVISLIIDEKYPQIPYIIVLSPICLLRWLIKAEGIAIVSMNHPNLPAFICNVSTILIEIKLACLI